MTRVATLVLLAGLTPSPSPAADLSGPKPIPTSPQVPQPAVDQNGGVVPASGVSRVLTPVRERPGYLVTKPAVADGGQPLPTGYALVRVGDQGANCGPYCGPSTAGACGDGASWSCLGRLKAWLCFQPTTRDALPKLRPHPYVGPIAGTFYCTPAAGVVGGCGSGGCGSGTCVSGGCDGGTCGPRLAGKFGPLVPGRGRNGGCVSPADDALAGYRFAPASVPAVVGSPPPAAHTSYKPAQGAVTKPSADPLARPFTRP